MSRQALGRGLEALIPVMADTSQLEDREVKLPTHEIAVDLISPNPYQPRKDFHPNELEELAASIRENGVVQPILVRPLSGHRYELVAGERRLRAAKLAGLAQVPAVVREMDDKTSLEIALIENLQRSDLNCVEEAWAYRQLIDEFNLTQELVAKRVGRDRSSVANTLRLLKLPPTVLMLVKERRLSEGHARALLTIDDPEAIERFAERVVRDGMTVRETEAMMQGVKPERTEKTKKVGAAPAKDDPHAKQLSEELRRKLGTQVIVIPKNDHKGKIEIEYYSLEDLDRIISLIG
jgi:ParB family chromosome partitioning protein